MQTAVNIKFARWLAESIQGVSDSRLSLRSMRILNVLMARPVLPNLCAAAHKCAAIATEVYRGRMSEIKVSMRSFFEIFNSHLKLLIFYIRPWHTSNPSP